MEGLLLSSASESRTSLTGEGKYCIYGSVSEQAGTAKKVRFEKKTEAVYKDVKAMQGIQTACEGQYGPMLVPYSMLDPIKGAYEPEAFRRVCGIRNSEILLFVKAQKLKNWNSETHEESAS